MTLREYRIASGMSQQDVADLLVMSRALWCDIENHRRSMPARVAELVTKRLGWEFADCRVSTRLTNGRKVESDKANTIAQPRVQDQGWVLYMMALLAYDGEVPKDWRNVQKHPDLARSAMYAAVGQMTAKGRMLHA